MANFPTTAPPDNAFVQSIIDAAVNNPDYTAHTGGDSRLSRRLLEHQRRKNGKGGCIRTADGRLFLDTESAGALDGFTRDLEGRTTWEIGELVDWTLRLAIRPTAKSSAASIASYAFQSFFIDVSEHGRNDTLPQRLVAEMIQVGFEWFVNVLSYEITGVDAEDALRDGFEAVSNLRKSGISKELVNQVDNYFDVAVDAIRLAAEKGQIRGGKVSADGVELLAKEFGRVLANELSTASAERKKRMLHDPVEVFDFYNEILTKGKMSFQLEDDGSIRELKARKARLIQLEKENEELRSKLTTTAKDSGDSLKGTRDAASAQSKGMAV